MELDSPLIHGRGIFLILSTTRDGIAAIAFLAAAAVRVFAFVATESVAQTVFYNAEQYWKAVLPAPSAIISPLIENTATSSP